MLFICIGGHAVVPLAGSALNDELRHARGHLVVRMHLRRAVPAQAAVLRPIGGRPAVKNLRVTISF